MLRNKIIILALLWTSCFNPEPLDNPLQTVSSNESGTSDNYPTTQIIETNSTSEIDSTSESSNALSITSSTSVVSTSENVTSVIHDLPNIMDMGSLTTEMGLESDSADIPTSDVIICGDGVHDIGEECDDGNRLDTDDCSVECFEPKVVFLSYEYIGKPDFGGLNKADDFCQLEAFQWNVPGVFRAWISDDNADQDPYVRFNNLNFKGWYKLLSGLPIAKGWLGLQGGLLNPINITATGSVDMLTNRVWTNTTANGKRKLNTSSCANWKSLNDNAVGLGNPQFITDNWTDAGTTNCDGNTGPGKVYCFQID